MHWVTVREAVTAGTLRSGDKTALEVAARFDALLRYASLRLGRQLGTDVLHVLTRKEQADPELRAQSLLQSLVADGVLSGAIRIPNTVAPIHLAADLRAGRVSCYVDIEAPKEGRATTRVNWLIGQPKTAPESIRVEAFALNTRGAGATELLGKVREDPSLLIADPKRELRSFRVAMTAPMGAKRGRGQETFIDSVLNLIDVCYGEVMQHRKAWSAAPPKMRETAPVPDEKPALSSTALSSQDGTEVPDETAPANANPEPDTASDDESQDGSWHEEPRVGL